MPPAAQILTRPIRESRRTIDLPQDLVPKFKRDSTPNSPDLPALYCSTSAKVAQAESLK